MKYIDIHGHINFPEYDADREEVIRRAQDAGVGIVLVGTDLESSEKCVELAEKYDDMWAVVGMHPTHVTTVRGDQGHGHAGTFDKAAFQKLAANPKVIAIGECGLDYFHTHSPAGVLSSAEMEDQEKVFIEHIEVANTVGKPLMLHVRNGNRNNRPNPINAESSGRPVLSQSNMDVDNNIVNAYQQSIEILKEHAKVSANFHFFAGTMDDMNSALAIGCNISFTGVITFARNYDELIKSVPLDRVMSETDCPYVSPIPYRGKRNEPVYVIEVVKQIAKIRGESEESVRAMVLNNAEKFFGLHI